MAAIAAANATVLYDTGSGYGERTVLYLVKVADTGDTFDVTSKFSEVKIATFLASGVLTAAGTVSNASGVLTLTLATMADDNIYLLVMGQSAV